MKWVPGRDIIRIYRTIEALLILHNLFRKMGDRPQDIPEYSPEDELILLNDQLVEEADEPVGLPPDPADQTRAALRTRGLQIRENLVAAMGEE